MTTVTRLTLDDFLAMEETKRYREFVRGEIWEKPMPGPLHSAIVLELGALLRNYLRETREGRGGIELRHADRNEDRAYLPDMEVALRGQYPKDQLRGVVELPADLAIEVLSPDDRADRVLDKIQFYLRAGVQLTWLIDPERETVTAYRPGHAPEQFAAPAVIDAQPVLRSFTLDLAALFAVLHEDEDA